MRKTIIGFMVVGILASYSCKKKNAPDGGSWTFKSNTYSVTSATTNSYTDYGYGVQANVLTAINSASGQYNQVQFAFVDLPTANGTYNIIPDAYPDTNINVSISLKLTKGSNYDQTMYTPDPSVATVATVTIQNGKMKVSIPATDMVNVNDTADRGSFSADIIQTQ